MSQLLTGQDFCFTYLDDILIYGTSRKEHLHHLETAFSHLQAVNSKNETQQMSCFQATPTLPRNLISEKAI